MQAFCKIQVEKKQEKLKNDNCRLDDIQDSSILRRGVPVAHSIYGVPSTINAANYVICIALEKTLDLKHPEVTELKPLVLC